MPDLDSPSSIGSFPHPSESHRLAILIFFCTLGETLQQHFLEHCVSRSNFSPKIQASLLQDILHPLEHIEQPFQTLTGATWQQAVKAASKHAKRNFLLTLFFFKIAVKKRNQLLLLGNKQAVSPDMAKQCITNMAPLINLFVELHNVYLMKPLWAFQSFTTPAQPHIQRKAAPRLSRRCCWGKTLVDKECYWCQWIGQYT